MTAFRHWLATLSVFAFGGATQVYAPPAQAAVSVAEIERACERALQENSIEAIEEFLYKYPPAKYRNDVACYALALGALNEFGNSNNNQRNPAGDEHVPAGGGGGSGN